MNYWLISDTHFGHAMLHEHGYRPVGFENKIFKGLSRQVKAGDIIIHTGDICIGNDADHNRLFTNFCHNLGAKVILVRGNHDHKKDNWYYKHGWDMVCKEFKTKLFGKKIIFTHIPQRFVSYDTINIHGHLHQNKNSHHWIWKLGKHYLVSMEELNYFPANLQRVLERI